MLVDLRGRECLVVGAGKVAADKLAGLLHHGVQIEVVSPRAVQSIRDQARAGTIQWHQRRFVPDDVRGKFLAVAATGSPRINQAVFRACAAKGVLCNSVDEPEHCHFFYPAVVRRGPLQIAISTGGCSPALAARLRRELQRQFGPEWSAWVEHLGQLRRQMLGQKMPATARRRRLQQMATATAFGRFLRQMSRDDTAAARKNRLPR